MPDAHGSDCGCHKCAPPIVMNVPMPAKFTDPHNWLRQELETALGESDAYEKEESGLWRPLVSPGELFQVTMGRLVTKCEGCPAFVLWAAHERTQKDAPLVLATSTGNIRIRRRPCPDPLRGRLWLYRMLKRDGSDAAVQPGESPFVLLNHFANCPKASRFHKR